VSIRCFKEGLNSINNRSSVDSVEVIRYLLSLDSRI